MKKSKIVSEFKEFIARGNVVDMAVGVVIGTAFKGIIDSLVSNIIMPFVGWLIGGINFSEYGYALPPIFGRDVSISTIAYGAFIDSVISFLIISIVLFLFVKMTNVFRRKKEAEAPPPPPPSEEVVLLSEIRDLLKAQKED